jgi:hypothetical protein
MRKGILSVISVLVLGIAAVFMCANAAEAAEFPQFVTEGLVSFWTFDEDDIDGSIVLDVWGENDGTIQGSPKKEAGQVGDALNMDGVEDLIIVPHHASIHFGNRSFTIEMWIKGINGPNGSRLWRKGMGGPPGKRYEGGINGVADGWVVWGVIDDHAAKTHCQPAAVNVVDWEQWHQAVYVRDMDEEQLFIYVDGQETVACEDMTGGDIGSTNSLYLGSNDPAEGLPVTPFVIDETRLYGRALSPDEIQQNFDVTDNSLSVGSAGKLSTVWGQIKRSSL